MYVAESLAVLRRRWYVLVLGLLLGAGSAVGLGLALPPEYEGGASLSVVAPQRDPIFGAPENPFLNYDAYLEDSARLIAALAAGEAFADQVYASDATGDYSVEAERAFLYVEVDDDTPGGIRATAEAVIDALEGTLTSLQPSAAPPDRLQLQVVVPPDNISRVPGKQLRMAGMVAALGGVGSIWSAFVLDGVLLARRRRAAPTAPGPLHGSDGPPGAALAGAP